MLAFLDKFFSIAGVVATLCVVLVLLPPKYDPAIRWKERNERKRK